MTILFDHQIFSTQIYGGVSRYFSELMKNFKNDNEIEYELSLRYSNNHYLKQFDNLPCKPFFENSTFRGKHRLLDFLNERISKKIISKGDYDVFHPTYYDPYFLNFLNNKPFVLTVYDMIHEIYPEMFLSKDKITERKKLLAQKATKIIAISKSTKRDIIRFFGIDENKIEVIYLGNSLNISKSDDALNIELPEKHILFVGNRGGYKNFDLFIKAITPLLLEDAELSVVCVGDGKFDDIEIEKFKSLNIKDKVFQYSVSDNILAYLYQRAIVFVFPSLYEGFGIPILESFVCGCPVLVGEVSSLPEIAGDAGVYFDPTNIVSIYDTVKRIIYDKELRKSLKLKGFQRVKNFSWEKTAEKTKSLYESII